MELEEESNAIGFLASDGVLYCSMACAKQQGRRTGYEVDQDEYESLIDSGCFGKPFVTTSAFR